jgi:GGDEF domain-containing protein
VISLKRYLGAGAGAGAGEQTAFREAISLLIAKMGSSAVRCDFTEFTAFKTNIAEISGGLAPELPPDNCKEFAEQAAIAITAYNKKITSLVSDQQHEVKDILTMMGDTVVSIGGESTRSGRRLQEITTELEESGPITDLRVLKGRLTECLSALQEEMRLQKAEAASTMEKLQTSIARGRAGVEAMSGVHLDKATGLRCREDGIAAMATAADCGTPQYAVIMVINRLQMINARFGHDVGDRMLAGFREYVQSQLAEADRLFRWTGPALVAIVGRPAPVGKVRLEMKQFLEAKIEVTYTGEGRSVLLPISAAWSVLPLTSATEADKRIQTFIATQNIT